MIYAFPFLLLVAGFGFWALQASRRRGKPAYLDIGWAFLLVVLIYGFVPGIGFLLAYLGIGEILDSRVSTDFDVSLVENAQLTFLCFVVGFIFIYSLVRRYSNFRFNYRGDAGRKVGWLIGMAVIFAVGLPLVRLAVGVQQSSDYIGSYTELRSMPLWVQQVFGIAGQLSFALLVAAIVFLVARRPKVHAQVAILIAIYLVYITLTGGSRSAAFLCFFAYLIAASVYVRGFSVRAIILWGFPALALFVIAGFVRDQVSDGSYLGVFQSGEFTSLFVNAVDLKDRVDSGLVDDVRFAFYAVDILRLIPAQLLGGVKIDPATWYVETFYPDFYDAGGGLAFGVVAESVVGFGAPEAAFRGALLGLVFAWAANRLIEKRTTATKVFIYVWLVVMSYQSFRDTTFSLVTRGLYQLLPILVMLKIAGIMKISRRHEDVSPVSAELAT